MICAKKQKKERLSKKVEESKCEEINKEMNKEICDFVCFVFDSALKKAPEKQKESFLRSMGQLFNFLIEEYCQDKLATKEEKLSETL